MIKKTISKNLPGARSAPGKIQVFGARKEGEQNKMKHFGRAKRTAQNDNFCQNYEKFTFGAQGLSEMIDPKNIFVSENVFL